MADRRSLDASDQHTRERFQLASARLDRPEWAIPYRVVVLGASARDVVQAAGGLIFDRIRSGWEAVAMLPDSSDERPLRILGAKAIRADGEDAQQVMTEVPHALVVSADLLCENTSIGQWIHNSLNPSLTALWVWDLSTVRQPNVAALTKHHLSSAARIFKTAALRAASVPVERCAHTEIFRNGR